LYILQIGKVENKTFIELEKFNNLSPNSEDPDYIIHRVNDASNYIEVDFSKNENILGQILTEGTNSTATSGTNSIKNTIVVNLTGGTDGLEPEPIDYQNIFTQLLKYRDISIICLPGQHWPEKGKEIISSAISHAETMKNCMVIIDSSPGKELSTETIVNDLSLPTSTYSVLYYPWLKVSNPFYHAETNPGALWTVLIPPCGFSAGIWSKTDTRRGVWKAPAGVETNLLGIAGLQYIIEDSEQDQLNPLGVNCIRKQPGFGHVIWGSRTLSTKSNPEWRYVPVRRTAIMIEQSIYNGIQWAVFEPNDHLLWSALRLNIDSFMNGLFRSGAFLGETVSEAYFVRCGLGDTMTQGDIDRGQVIVIVGFAPLKPAEFVIVRIQQKIGQQ
jgi:phage tail sheath protein FI